jgi:hypothetical protein
MLQRYIFKNNDDESPIVFNEILSMSFMHITMFVVPLTHEATSWSSLKNHIKKCDFENSLIDLADCVIRTKIVTDIPYDNYNVIMTIVRL